MRTETVGRKEVLLRCNFLSPTTLDDLMSEISWKRKVFSCNGTCLRAFLLFSPSYCTVLYLRKSQARISMKGSAFSPFFCCRDKEPRRERFPSHLCHPVRPIAVSDRVWSTGSDNTCCTRRWIKAHMSLCFSRRYERSIEHCPTEPLNISEFHSCL